MDSNRFPAFVLLLAPLLGGLLTSATLAAQSAAGFAVQPLPFQRVQLADQFWQPRLRIQAETLVPFALEKTQPAADNLAKAARFLAGDTTELPFPHRYISSDLYKVMEGAAYLLTNERDPALEQRLDTIIDTIAAAQRADGYLYVAHITGVSRDHDHWGGGGMGDRPYSHVIHSHELYNMGHLYEAAVAYYRATGKDQLLRVAEKNARHLNRVFFQGDPAYNDGQPVRQAPGHEEIELALVKLYRTTGDTLYLGMAKRFLDIRGVTYVPAGEQYFSPTYAQQHQPVAEQTEPVGHAVRAAYLYTGMADVGAMYGTDEYSPALQRIWTNITDKKMHITGGLGAQRGIEGFGADYELPNATAYNETCAAVGNVLFNHRMFLLHRDAKYMDVAEVALYNNALAGVNLAGNEFFYVNPLAADGKTPFNHGEPGRSPWFNTACCPSNIARLIPQVPGMLYAYAEDELYALLYAGSTATVPLGGGPVGIRQETTYPFGEQIRFTLAMAEPRQFAFKLRIPTWAQGARFVPGQLYAYANAGPAAWSVRVNGQPVVVQLRDGFAVLDRQWHPGDVVTLTLPQPVRFNRADARVAADRGKLAVTRGPLVYCAEGVDNGGRVADLQLSGTAVPTRTETAYLTDPGMERIVSIRLPVQRQAGRGRVAATATLIPYYAWNNRGDGPMRVWLEEQ
jgi:DUF1680 family protein